MATYSIVGPGGSSSNPVHVFVGCDDTVTEVCWTARISRLDNCNVEMYRDEMICQTASTYTNQLTWTAPNGQVLTVHYEIHRPSHEECHPTPPGCFSACTNLTAYAVPGSVEEGSTDEIKVYYEYLLECYGTKTGVVTGLTLSDFTPEGDLYKYTYTTSDSMVSTQCSTDVYVHKKGGDDCTEGCVADISITFSKNVVPASGATIQVIVSFKKTVTDENCKKKVTTGSFSYPWEVKCTSTGDNDKHCCKDHYVEGHISIATIKERAKLGDCELRYEGEQTALDYYYKVLQKAKTTEECEGYCEEKTTYCADQSTVKVCYEKRYLSNEWVCEGDPSTDCDCSALSIEGVNGAYAVPFTGGRIKVTWQYSAHTTTETCNEYDTLGRTWEEIITIGGCDERPIDCKPEYNKVVVDDQGHTAIYDDTTYKDCKICDSECCYNYDGKGTCKCVILFKEQTPGCTTCDSCDVYDEEEQRVITYNKIRYEFVQDCTTICNYDKNTQFEQQVVEVDKCFTGETAATVPFTSTTEYYGAGCPAPQYDSGSVPVTVNIPTVNNSKRDKVAYEDEMIKVVQKAGPCEVPTYCDCDALTLDGGGGDCPESQTTYVYGTVELKCRKYDHEAVDVPYTKYCNGSRTGSGTSAKTISVDCNKGTSKSFSLDGINFHQAGGCTDAECNTIECDATENEELTRLIPAFTGSVGTNITVEGTPCTYKYMSMGLTYLSTLGEKYNNLQSKMWLLANILSELTPVTAKASKYFDAAAHNDNGGDLKLNSEEEVGYYENRNRGAIAYALFKHNNFDASVSAAGKARTELMSKGITTAKLRTEDPTALDNEDVVHAMKITTGSSQCGGGADNRIDPNGYGIFPSGTFLNLPTDYDYKYAEDLIEEYDTVESVKGKNGQNDYQPILDKYHCVAYYKYILGLDNTSDNLLTAINNYSGKESGRLKYAYWRGRPNPTMKPVNGGELTCDSGVDANGMCGIYIANYSDNRIYPHQCSLKPVAEEVKQYALGINAGLRCPACNNYNDPHTSFPSGHSVLAFLNLLAVLEKYGDRMNVSPYISRIKRIDDYCENRAVVRAHWKTDTVAGKIVSSIQIGFLNGFTKFANLAKSSSSPTPSDCHDCDVIPRFVGDGQPGHGRPTDAGYAAKAGYPIRDKGPYVIGYYRSGTCSESIEFTKKGHTNITDAESENLWRNVVIETKPEGTTLYAENGTSVVAMAQDCTHFITASYIPANPKSGDICIQFFCKNPECHESGGSIDHFSLNQKGSS